MILIVINLDHFSKLIQHKDAVDQITSYILRLKLMQKRKMINVTDELMSKPKSSNFPGGIYFQQLMEEFSNE